MKLREVFLLKEDILEVVAILDMRRNPSLIRSKLGKRKN